MSKAIIGAIVFRVNTRGDSRVIVGESGVSGVDWDIGVFGMVVGPLEFFLTFK